MYVFRTKDIVSMERSSMVASTSSQCGGPLPFVRGRNHSYKQASARRLRRQCKVDHMLSGNLQESGFVSASPVSEAGTCHYLQAVQEMTEQALGEAIRADFPILHQQVNDKPLIYLDNAATSQKPTFVLDSITDYYSR